MNPPDRTARGVRSIELGARLLAALTGQDGPVMLKDLARLAGFAPAQAHAYLASYRKIGLVEQDPESGRYMLGRFAIDLGIARMRVADPIGLAGDRVIALSERTGLIVCQAVWGSFGPTVIQVQEGRGQINMNTRPGTVYSLTGTASGRVFAAHMPPETVRAAIRAERRENGQGGRIGRHRAISRRELDQIRAAGYATIEEDPPVPHVRPYAAPVFDHIGQIVLVITIIGNEALMRTRAEAEFIPALLETTAQLSADLGHGRPVPA